MKDDPTDGLVTCREYQVFLDERRTRGLYHQPDHWPGHHHQSGVAGDPILGVRSSDASAYCAWRTEQESGRWRFRLPSIQEAARISVDLSPDQSLGYWVIGYNDQTQFQWISPNLENARRIDLLQTFVKDIERSNLNIADKERARGRVFNLLRVFKLEQALSRALDLDHNLALARRQAREHAGSLHLDLAASLAESIDREFDRDLDRALDLSRALDRSVERSEALKHARAHAFKQAIEPGRSIDRSLTIDLVIYIDLVTLHERIAGRSPAFEGICVVKEKLS